MWSFAASAAFFPRREVPPDLGIKVQTVLTEMLRQNLHVELSVQIRELNNFGGDGYQLGYFDGLPYVSRMDAAGKISHLDSEGIWKEGPHPSELFVASQPSTTKLLRRRFKIPPGLYLVGLETNGVGRIIPIFSDSPQLLWLRDVSEEQLEYVRKNYDQEPRTHFVMTASMVPLVGLKVEGPVLGNLEDLPVKIQKLLQSGKTLSTLASATHAHPEFVDRNIKDFSAFMIGNSTHGRVGVVFYRGLPLLRVIKNQEYFTELKGVGVAEDYPLENSLHERQHWGLNRTGRVRPAQLPLEFLGYEKSIEHSPLERHLEILRSIPKASLTIPELVVHSEDGKAVVLSPDDLSSRAADQLAGQLFRFATSTRRLIFSANIAFGLPYSQQRVPLMLAQFYLGKILADLLLRPDDPAFHDSLHAENLIYFPLFQAVLHTDYCDIHQEREDRYRALGTLFEFHIFRQGMDRPLPFYLGLKDSLTSRGLWTSRIAAFFSKPSTISEFWQLINEEYLAFFEMRFTDDRMAPLPALPETPTKEDVLALGKKVYRLGLSTFIHDGNPEAGERFREAGLKFFFLAEALPNVDGEGTQEILANARKILKEVHEAILGECERRLWWE